MSKFFCFCFFVAFSLVSCRSSVDIDNFDEAAFQSDPDGCAGTRLAMKDNLFAADTQIKALTQEEVQATLGKPDRQELASRSQKYFVYYIEPSPACTGDSTATPLTLYIRFSAMNRASEIKYENY